MTNANAIYLFLLLILIVGSIWYLNNARPDRIDVGDNEIVLENMKENRSEIIKEKEGKYERAKEIVSPHGYINTDEINVTGLIGKKVILIDFWTYSCINCQRTMPYLRDWYGKYKDKGLEIIGVHTPEFEFEKDYDNVVDATKRFNLEHPVVLDNDYATWNSYQNRYWPRKYLIDIDGFIVYDHIGEGAYEETEKKIQELLLERSEALAEDTSSKDLITDTDVVSDSDRLEVGSPEVYFGSSRNELLANGIPGKSGAQSLSAPEEIKGNSLYLVGDWNIDGEFAKNTKAQAKIIFYYRASKVNFVASAENDSEIEIYLDGKIISNKKGTDVDENGVVTINKAKLYNLVDDDTIGEYVLEIIIQAPGVKAFTFTFG